MRRFELVILPLIVFLGASLGGVMSEAWASWRWSQNIQEDEIWNPILDVEKYGLQVIEATIWSWGIALMVTMGMLAWWLDWRRRE